MSTEAHIYILGSTRQHLFLTQNPQFMLHQSSTDVQHSRISMSISLKRNLGSKKYI